jgi:hypothetical protein
MLDPDERLHPITPVDFVMPALRRRLRGRSG